MFKAQKLLLFLIGIESQIFYVFKNEISHVVFIVDYCDI